jgi:hypothetical protein
MKGGGFYERKGMNYEVREKISMHNDATRRNSLWEQSIAGGTPSEELIHRADGPFEQTVFWTEEAQFTQEHCSNRLKEIVPERAMSYTERYNHGQYATKSAQP